MDDVKSGLQPFIVVDGSAEQRQANLEVSHLYGLLNSGEQSMMLADLELLKSKEIQAVPLNYFELERNIGMFGNLLGVVLGSQHVLTTKDENSGIS
jgi:succinyl-CoA synthetase beta subunit